MLRPFRREAAFVLAPLAAGPDEETMKHRLVIALALLGLVAGCKSQEAPPASPPTPAPAAIPVAPRAPVDAGPIVLAVPDAGPTVAAVSSKTETGNRAWSLPSGRLRCWKSRNVFLEKYAKLPPGELLDLDLEEEIFCAAARDGRIRCRYKPRDVEVRLAGTTAASRWPWPGAPILPKRARWAARARDARSSAGITGRIPRSSRSRACERGAQPGSMLACSSATSRALLEEHRWRDLEKQHSPPRASAAPPVFLQQRHGSVALEHASIDPGERHAPHARERDDLGIRPVMPALDRGVAEHRAAHRALLGRIGRRATATWTAAWFPARRTSTSSRL